MIKNLSESKRQGAALSRKDSSAAAHTLVAAAISIALGAIASSSVSAQSLTGVNAEEPTSGFRTIQGDGPDTDADGIYDKYDLDDDNDGILDSSEGGIDSDGNGLADTNSVDTDGDGVPDVYDLDSDNDGILDSMEARSDSATVRMLDTLTNGAIDLSFAVGANGIPDIIETSVDSNLLNFKLADSDYDGTPDFRDLDSDGDGIFDVVEAGGVDSDNDGKADGFYDVDGKGVNDIVQVTSLPLFDTDGDGQLDFRDTDSDDDTLSDYVESGGSRNEPTDTDDDGAPDYRETDSDNDGISDQEEAAASEESPPQDDPGSPDSDGDGIGNVVDLDDDNDSILDTEEGLVDANGDGVPDATSRDSDSDGVVDALDLDSDNDGILDLVEARFPYEQIAAFDTIAVGAIALSFPVGANGVPDVIETSVDSGSIISPLLDTDGDGTPNYLDTDSDNDGIADIIEAGGQDDDFDGRADYFEDVDQKGVDDKIQASALPVFDTDGDGIRDYLDLDSDQDTIPDQVESGGVFVWPTDSDQDGAADYRETDSDNDGVADSIEVGPDPLQPLDTNDDELPNYQDPAYPVDNGATGTPTPPVTTPTPDTLDSDGDGIVDSIDTDDDNDGISDETETTGDSDSDGVPNNLDRDSDNDGVLDIRETAIDTDGDTIPDYIDLDSDNDGVYDALEAGRENIASTGRLLSSATVDVNGLAEGASDQRLDTDSDGVVDMLDLDSDNDSLLDVLESGFPSADADGRITPFTDTNFDGADDSMPSRGTTLRDTDGDRIADIRDLDSDQDGISDILEMAGPGLDQDNSGQIDNFVDGNSDGLDDTVAVNPTPQTDTDNDSNPNSTDLDSDNDGISDLDEAGGVDANNDARNDLMSDGDMDGVPDQNDPDFTGGADTDADGIEDASDVDFVAGPDTDGDGIVDSRDPDADGNGFVGPVVDDGTGTVTEGDLTQGTPITLPDVDADGIADLNEGVNLGGIIETGLDGSGFGCSITTVSNVSKTDPMLAFLLGGSLMFLGFRLKRRRVAQVAVIASTVAISGCSSLGLDMDMMDFDLGRFAPDTDVDKRVYVGAGLLMSQLEPRTDLVVGVDLDETQSAGLSGTLGYDFANRFSVEGHYANLGEATLAPAGTVGYSVAGLSALVYGLNDSRDRANRTGFSVYGRLGLGMMENDVSVVQYRRLNDMHVLAGVGVEYGMSNGLAVRGELTAHETDAKYAQLGLVYRFAGSGRDRAPLPIPVDRLPEVAPVDVQPTFEPEPQLQSDIDGDGVSDLMDNCPTTRPGSPVNLDGCAIFNGAIEGINFETNSDRLTDSSLAILSGVARTLQEYPDVRVTIEAHTDNMGSATSNLQLSKRRAISVARFLVDEGISGSRLRPQAFGESKPRISNATKEGRAANRRVEFSVL